MKKCIILLLILLPVIVFSQTLTDYSDVYFYPHILSPGDILTDGPRGEPVEIKESTVLIWVDYYPLADYAHPTLYTLISHESVRLIHGMWSPFLNKKSILLNEIGQYALISPLKLHENTPIGFNVYIFPHELNSNDVIADGPSGNIFRLLNNTLFIWVDFAPNAKYAHDTAYILLAKRRSRVEKGSWWPILNNKVILYNQTNKLAVISPFVLANPYEQDVIIDESAP